MSPKISPTKEVIKKKKVNKTHDNPLKNPILNIFELKEDINNLNSYFRNNGVKDSNFKNQDLKKGVDLQNNTNFSNSNNSFLNFNNSHIEFIAINNETKNDSTQLNRQIEKIKEIGKNLLANGNYLEAFKVFKSASNFLLEKGYKKEALFFTLKSNQIQNLIIDQKEKINLLEQAKNKEDYIKSFELYELIIDISEKLNDYETLNKYKKEFEDFKINKINIKQLENIQTLLENKAQILKKEGYLEEAFKLY
ncbi:MAG: hypothetical protein ACTSWR_02665, partial [Candidatus Helarchaeota archaeon]